MLEGQNLFHDRLSSHISTQLEAYGENVKKKDYAGWEFIRYSQLEKGTTRSWDKMPVGAVDCR